MVQHADNLLLSMLPPADRAPLSARMEEVVIPPGTVLYEAEQSPRYAWFVTSGLVSNMVAMSDGRTAEVNLLGNEGVIPALHLLDGPAASPTRCVVQTETQALRIPLHELKREMHRSEALRSLVQRCFQRRSLIVAQMAACNRLHDAEQRLSRWLLTAHYLTGKPTIGLSQGFLADILGSRRTTVTLAAGVLRRRGYIDYRRSHIHILDRNGLQSAACECYQTVQNLFQNFYK
jgi:CRP-like cAMP-binding protein